MKHHFADLSTDTCLCFTTLRNKKTLKHTFLSHTRRMCVATAVGLSEPLQKSPGSGSFDNLTSKGLNYCFEWLDG